jgi:hypothetical protein
MASPEELRERVGRLAEELAMGARYDVSLSAAGPGVDAYPFHEEGIPIVSLSHFPYADYHLPSERLELVDERRIEDTVELAARVLDSLLAEPEARSAKASAQA